MFNTKFEAILAISFFSFLFLLIMFGKKQNGTSNQLQISMCIKPNYKELENPWYNLLQ